MRASPALSAAETKRRSCPIAWGHRLCPKIRWSRRRQAEPERPMRDCNSVARLKLIVAPADLRLPSGKISTDRRAWTKDESDEGRPGRIMSDDDQAWCPLRCRYPRPAIGDNSARMPRDHTRVRHLTARGDVPNSHRIGRCGPARMAHSQASGATWPHRDHAPRWHSKSKLHLV